MTREDDPFMSMSETSPRTLGAFPPASAGVPLTESSLRHHDGGPLLAAGLARSNSGRLPPAYEDSWDSDQSRRTHPTATAGSESAPRSDFSRSEVTGISDSGVRATESSHVPLSAASGYGYGELAARGVELDDSPSGTGAAPSARRRALPVPAPLALGASGDAKDASLFN